MSSEDDQERMPTRDIYELRRRVRQVRSQYYREMNQVGACSAKTRTDIQTIVLEYWDALHEYAEDIEETWEEHNLDSVPQLAREMVDASTSTPGYGSSSTTVRKPAISQMDPQRLVEITHKFDDVAHELGFAASAKDQPNNTEITEEMIEEVEKWRQQNLE